MVREKTERRIDVADLANRVRTLESSWTTLQVEVREGFARGEAEFRSLHDKFDGLAEMLRAMNGSVRGTSNDVAALQTKASFLEDGQKNIRRVVWAVAVVIVTSMITLVVDHFLRI